MAFKFLIAFVLIAAASAGYIPTAQVYQQVGQPILTKAAEEYDPNPQYTYSYGVDDAITGDSKSQVETRNGDVVHGEYTLNDADGYKRIVKYTADPINGFNAVVQRVPLVKAVVPVAAAPVYKAAPVVYAAAPAVVKSTYVPQTVVNQVPVTYSAPVYAQYH